LAKHWAVRFSTLAWLVEQEAFTTALRQFLEKNGMDPDRLPKINLSYWLNLLNNPTQLHI
jgi:hypothetical protein